MGPSHFGFADDRGWLWPPRRLYTNSGQEITTPMAKLSMPTVKFVTEHKSMYEVVRPSYHKRVKNKTGVRVCQLCNVLMRESEKLGSVVPWRTLTASL